MGNFINETKRSSWNRFNLPVDEIIALYKSGFSEQRLAKKFGVNRGTIRRRLLETGTEIRRQKDANFLRSGNYSVEERRRMAKTANEVRRGMKVSWQTKCKHARTIEKQPYASGIISNEEKKLFEMLKDRNIDTIPQKAIGGYNCDLAAYPIAVEIFGGNFHWYGRAGKRFFPRSTYILNQGWFLYIISIAGWQITRIDADKIASYIKTIRRNKPAITEYRVVGRAGDLFATGRTNGNHLTFIPTPTCPNYISSCLDK